MDLVILDHLNKDNDKGQNMIQTGFLFGVGFTSAVLIAWLIGWIICRIIEIKKNKEMWGARHEV